MNNTITRSIALLAGLALVAGCGVSPVAKSGRPDAVDEGSLGIWYGPGSINTVTRGLRDDFMSQVTDKSNWPVVHANTVVFKQFIETLYPRRKSGAPCYSDATLKRLAGFVTGSGFKSAFEVGALRWSPKKKDHGPGRGKRYAAEEIKLLQRWVAAGGTVDYLPSDPAAISVIDEG